MINYKQILGFELHAEEEEEAAQHAAPMNRASRQPAGHITHQRNQQAPGAARQQPQNYGHGGYGQQPGTQPAPGHQLSHQPGPQLGQQPNQGPLLQPHGVDQNQADGNREFYYQQGATNPQANNRQQPGRLGVPTNGTAAQYNTDYDNGVPRRDSFYYNQNQMQGYEAGGFDNNEGKRQGGEFDYEGRRNAEIIEEVPAPAYHASTNQFEADYAAALDQLKSRFSDQVTVQVNKNPLLLNQDRPDYRVEELVTLRHLNQSQQDFTLMFLVDFVSKQCFWFSESDAELGQNLEPNINDQFEMNQLISILSTRKFLQ